VALVLLLASVSRYSLTINVWDHWLVIHKVCRFDCSLLNYLLSYFGQETLKWPYTVFESSYHLLATF